MMSVERALAKAAAALLPGLLPTPPRSTMTTPSSCLMIIPPAPKPGRADSVERWDAHKKEKRPGSPASSASSSSSSSSCERWDVNKKKTPSRCSSSSSWSSSSCERWDSNKRPPSRASSGDRWDAHKKARSAQADAESQMKKQEINGNQSWKEETRAMVPTTAPRRGLMFSGPSFVDSPDPSMLPMPTFFRSHGAVPAFLPVH